MKKHGLISKKMRNYHCVECMDHGGHKITRRVTIKGGKGYKMVTSKKRGKRNSTIKKILSDFEMKNIMVRKFVPGLFNDCKNCKDKTKK